MTTTNFKFVEAYRAHNLPQAHVIGLALEEAGHRVLIENESDAGYPPGWSSDPRLLVEESHLAAATEIIGQIDHSQKSKLRLTLASTVGLLIIFLAAVGLLGPAVIVCVFLAAIVSLLIAYARIRSYYARNQGGTARCLACNATMSETESACQKCGWTYESSLSAESQ